MSRIARHDPDNPEAWDSPRLVAEWNYRVVKPARCLCSHSKSQHTRGEGQCWSAACGCRSFRPKESTK